MNYVMLNPTITGIHLNSVYLFYNNTDYAEIGWVWERGWANPRYFTAFLRWPETVPTQQLWGAAPRGTNVMFEINSQNLDTNWNLAVNGSVLRRVFLNFYIANPLASSERLNRNESGYGHFWNLKKKDYDHRWVNWTNLREFDHPDYDNDPGYRLDKRSNTEFYAVAN